jgi:hypothetical protein
MTKRRFDIGVKPTPSSPMFEKPGKPEINIGQGSSKAIESSNQTKVGPANTAKPKKAESMDLTTSASKKQAFVKSHIRVGVSTSLSGQLNELCKAGGFTEEYALHWLLPQTSKRMADVNITTMMISTASLELEEPTKKKWVQVDSETLAKFRAVHDPLDAFSIAFCLRHIHLAAFAIALEDLAARLK